MRGAFCARCIFQYLEVSHHKVDYLIASVLAARITSTTKPCVNHAWVQGKREWKAGMLLEELKELCDVGRSCLTAWSSATALTPWRVQAVSTLAPADEYGLAHRNAQDVRLCMAAG